MNRKIYVLGAGVSGLSVAYELLKLGEDVTLIERSSSVGGLAKSIPWKGRNIDLGPHIYHTPDKDIENYWLNEFKGLFHVRDHWAKNFKDGNFYDYPISKQFIDELPSTLRDKINKELSETNKEKLSKSKNYHEYIQNLVGKTLQEMFFIKYPEKLWGLSTKELDSNWAPKRIQFRDKKTPFYWGQWSAVGIEGSGSIINALEHKVKKLKGTIYLNDEIKKITLEDEKIKKIETKGNVFNIDHSDLVINTTSYTNISKVIGEKTNLKYRGVILVFLEVKQPRIFPENIDFVYIDDVDIPFNRLSDQNSFVKNPDTEKTVICCEITYSHNDYYDNLSDKDLIKTIKESISLLNFFNVEDIIDTKIMKLPEVYPMYSLGYREFLAKSKQHLDKINNLYNLGSLAEFAYSDLQILFGKAIDLAQLITDKTHKHNKTNKNTPRLNFNQEFSIRSRKIGGVNPAYIIAEIGLNHNGDINSAKELIDEAVNCGADAVKLQTYKSENRVAKHGKTSRYVEKILGIEETDFEMLLKYELSENDTLELFNYAKNKIQIFSTPFDIPSVDFLENLNIDCYKIASFDLVNLPLIRKIASTGKPIILSTGMSYLSEVEEALIEIATLNNKNVAILHCTSSYPCPPEAMNIKAIDTIKNAFNNLPVGLSDHVIGNSVSIAAVARGANVIEKHFTLDKKLEGPDHILSLEPKELKSFIEEIRIVESCLGNGIKQPSEVEKSTMIKFRKTMYSNKNLSKGSVLSIDDITYKGPAFGMYAKYEDLVVGKKITRDCEADTPISWDLFA